MIRGSLPDRVEYAILQIVMSYTDRTHQASWGAWRNDITALVPDLGDEREIDAAFRRLQKREIIRLAKYNGGQPWDFDPLGNGEYQRTFFGTGPFIAAITDEGRSNWGKLYASRIRNNLFISHITEEKPVAQVLQKYLKLAFGGEMPVFCSSDGKSIGGGKPWYNHIIDNLRLSEVVLVLMSQESKGRQWINFEAGFGVGMDCLVLPVAIKQMSVGQVAWPLAGLQARSIDDIAFILDDIATRFGLVPTIIDGKAFREEMEEAEASLIYKSLTVEPVAIADSLWFDIANVGNVDLELLMFEAHFPQCALKEQYFGGMNGIVEVSGSPRNGTPYLSYYCYSNRGVCGNIQPILRPVITPSMGKVRPIIEIPIRSGLSPVERELPVFFQIHAVGYRTQPEERKISEIPSWV
jgi:hypothetical protein